MFWLIFTHKQVLSSSHLPLLTFGPDSKLDLFVHGLTDAAQQRAAELSRKTLAWTLRTALRPMFVNMAHNIDNKEGE